MLPLCPEPGFPPPPADALGRVRTMIRAGNPGGAADQCGLTAKPRRSREGREEEERPELQRPSRPVTVWTFFATFARSSRLRGKVPMSRLRSTVACPDRGSHLSRPA